MCPSTKVRAPEGSSVQVVRLPFTGAGIFATQSGFHALCLQLFKWFPNQMPLSFSNMNGPPFISAKPSLIPYLSSWYSEITSISHISLVKIFKFWNPGINAPLWLEIQLLLPPPPPRALASSPSCPGESWQILGVESERSWPNIFCIFTLCHGIMVHLKKIGCDFSCIFFFFLQKNTVSHHLLIFGMSGALSKQGVCDNPSNFPRIILYILYFMLNYITIVWNILCIFLL